MDEEEKLLEECKQYAERNGFRLNPDEKVVMATIRGLLKREKEKGKRYCPCRAVSGNPEKDRGIICPCVFHKKEIAEQGRCHCRLFVSKE